MAPTHVHLARHGEVEGAAQRRFFGHTDVPLSAIGRLQVEVLAERLQGQPIEAVFASDLRRARDSAAPLARRLGLTPIVVPDLREIGMGEWEGLTLPEIEARDGELAERWMADPATFPFPGGESLEDLRRRVMPALRAIVAGHPGGRVAVFAHGGTNRVILSEALGLPLTEALRVAQDYAGVSLIEYGGGRAMVHSVNHRPAESAGAPPVESGLLARP